MTAQTAPLTVTKSITVAAPPERAFQVFTEGFNTWWPHETHSVGPQPCTSVLELHEGGRIYDRSDDGTESDWGRVLAFDPHERFVLAWHLGGDFAYDPEPARASEVEVTFTPEGGGTRVDLEHRHIERHGDTAEQLREAVSAEGGWGTLLGLYAEAARSAGSTSSP